MTIGAVDRREFPRMEVDCPASVEYRHNGGTISEQSRILNISAGGAYLATGRMLSPAQLVHLSVPISDGALFRVLTLGKEGFSSSVTLEAESEVVRTCFDPKIPGRFCAAVRFLERLRISQ